VTNNSGASELLPTAFIANNLNETHAIGKQIAAQLTFPSCVYLEGGMGVGKTTLTKSIIQGFGYSGEVTSPTYNLVQEYKVEHGVIYHMDLYRLEDPSEVEFLALEDLWCDGRCLFLIEWPEKGIGYLRKQDVGISIYKNTDNSSEERNIILKSYI